MEKLQHSLVIVIVRSTSQEGTTLLIDEGNAASSGFTVQAIRPLKDPNEGQNGEGESGPMNEAVEIVVRSFLRK